MKIKKLKINAYGKLENKEIELSDNINIIYGKNEAGKSTILKFILNMLYGTSKNKKGKFASDYEMYKPWEKDIFSGKMNYELDNGEKFEIYREFNKKNPKIFNSNLEEISKQFNIDKNLGNQFFYEQTKVDEDTFTSTCVSMQKEIKLNNASQNILIQKIANLAGTGEDNISYKKAIEKLSKKQTEEIGTARTQEKPINILEQKIRRLSEEKQELNSYKNLNYEFEENSKIIKNQIEKLEIKNEYLKNQKNIMQEISSENEKIEYNKKIIEKNNLKIDEIKKEIIKEKNNKKFELNNNSKKSSNNIILILVLINVILLFINLIVIKNNLINITLLFILLLNVIIFFVNKILKKNKMKKDNQIINTEINKKINQKNIEINILEKNNEEILKEINKIKEHINNIIKIKNEKNKNNYLNKIKKELENTEEQLNKELNEEIFEKNYIFNNFENIDNYLINNEIENIEIKINNKKIELHKMQLNKDNINPKLENLARIEEELENSKKEYEELLQKNNNINIAKQFLEKAYEKMKNNITPKFTEKLSKNLNNFSSGKYQKVIINDENGIMIELKNGNYISAENLSVGTIDQLYLALRLSMAEDITDESLPIILDEAFAFFDDERLKNVLLFITNNFKNRQIIILTCTNREKQILEELNIKYNNICV